MEIWVDTAELDLIQMAKEMGVIHGVTTNPSIIAKSQKPLEEVLEGILRAQEGPVTAQVTAEEAAKMVEQGEALVQFSPRLMVKVPVTTEGLKAIRALSQKGVATMATAVFDPNQVLLAARAGAMYIAPYFSAMIEADLEGHDAFKAMFRLLERYRYPSKLLAASLKSAEQVRQCLDLGVHAVTLNREVFLSFVENHPETVRRIEKFKKDWKSAKERKKLPL